VSFPSHAAVVQSSRGPSPPGLVGSALQYVIEHEVVGSRFGRATVDEKWVFLSSKDGDLR
jgi:hypothetical protein